MKMGQKENLDDFLKRNLDDDSDFEFNEADWAKAESLITNNQNNKVSYFSAKKIVGVLTVLIALVMYFVSTIVSDSLTKPKTSKTVTKQNKLDENATHSNGKIFNGNKNVDQSESNSKTNEISASNDAIVGNKKSITQTVSSNISVSQSSEDLNLNKQITVNNNLKSNRKSSAKNETNRLNEVQDYAEVDTKKHWFDFTKISLFKRNKIVDNYSQNFRNLIEPKQLSIAVINNEEAISNDYSDISSTVKIRKPFTFNLIAGVGIFKQFSGNIFHTNTPSIDPLTGFELNIYMNKKIGVTTQIIYSQRRGLNSQYISENGSGDSDLVSLTKLYSVELPISVTYNLNKKSACFAGISAIFYIANQSSITSSTAEPKLGTADGIIKTDAAIVFGYKYNINKKFVINANAIIGIRDVTKNGIYVPQKHDDNVSLRLGLGYTLFSRE